MDYEEIYGQAYEEALEKMAAATKPGAFIRYPGRAYKETVEAMGGDPKLYKKNVLSKVIGDEVKRGKNFATTPRSYPDILGSALGRKAGRDAAGKVTGGGLIPTGLGKYTGGRIGLDLSNQVTGGTDIVRNKTKRDVARARIKELDKLKAKGKIDPKAAKRERKAMERFA